MKLFSIILIILIFGLGQISQANEEECPPQRTDDEYLKQITLVNDALSNSNCQDMKKSNYKEEFLRLLKKKKMCTNSLLDQTEENKDFMILPSGSGPSVRTVKICNKCFYMNLIKNRESYQNLTEDLWDMAATSNMRLKNVLMSQQRIAMIVTKQADPSNLIENFNFNQFFDNLGNCMTVPLITKSTRTTKEIVKQCYDEGLRVLTKSLSHQGISKELESRVKAIENTKEKKPRK